jgi:NitT/TauT family transport system permease protein
MLAASEWGLGWVIFDAKEFLNADVMLPRSRHRLHRLRVRAAGCSARSSALTVMRWGMVRAAKS